MNEFVNKNPEDIIQETLDYYENKIGHQTAKSDVDRLFIDVMAYRETILRNLMESLMSQNFVETATDEGIDYWGELYGMVRLSNELDEDYRQRIREFISLPATGTKRSIKLKVLELADVTDVYIETRHDNDAMLPGYINVYPLIFKADTNGRLHGQSASLNDQNRILTTLNDNDFGFAGDIYSIKDIQTVTVTGSIQVDIATSFTINQQLRDKIENIVRDYSAALTKTFSPNFQSTVLEGKLLELPEVIRVNAINFNIPILNNHAIITLALGSLTLI